MQRKSTGLNWRIWWPPKRVISGSQALPMHRQLACQPTGQCTFLPTAMGHMIGHMLACSLALPLFLLTLAHPPTRWKLCAAFPAAVLHTSCSPTAAPTAALIHTQPHYPLGPFPRVSAAVHRPHPARWFNSLCALILCPTHPRLTPPPQHLCACAAAGQTLPSQTCSSTCSL